MNDFLRTLEGWTTYQDYVWFLAALAWLAVAFGASRRPQGKSNSRRERAPEETWLVVFAFSAVVGAALELVLNTQDIAVPYVWFDFAMGLVQAVGVAALFWPALERRWSVRVVRPLTVVGAGLLAAARVEWPAAAGGILSLAGIGAAWSACRGLVKSEVAGQWEKQEVGWLRGGFGLAGLLPAIATHGPLAWLAGEPRIRTDNSHFALLSASAVTFAGALLALAIWRRRLRVLHVRADIRWAVSLLLLWVILGLAFAVWSGQQARSIYKEDMLQRAATAAALLDSGMLRDALGPALQITGHRTRDDPFGRKTMLGTMPHGLSPAMGQLRESLARLYRANPHVSTIYVEVVRDDQVLIPCTRNPAPKNPGEGVIYRPATPDDLAHLKDRDDYFEGPVHNEWGDHFFIRAALVDPQTGVNLGWLVFDTSITRWMSSFTQTRLQGMALVALGTGLWSLTIAYRLRRAESLAAEQRASAASEADRLKSAFLANVSHELRTPIQSVLGYCELLGQVLVDVEQRRWLGALRTQGDTMLRLVNDLLDLGAMQTAAFRLRTSAVDLPALAADSVAALRPQADAKHLRLELDVARGTPTWVEADPVRLRQILLNLLANAVKFTEQGSVQLQIRRADECIEFVVTDTGPGIPVTKRDKLFQPFVRLNETERTEGAGLGLALVAGLCAAMDGTVVCADAAGSGAVFQVRLPLRLHTAPDATRAKEEVPPGYRGLAVLIAEDNTLVRELLMEFVRQTGADVTAVADGAAAVAACKTQMPDAILLDIAMPQMDGLAAARAIRQQPDARADRPWIVGLSAHGLVSDQTDAIAAGMNRFLVKPAGRNAIHEALRAAPIFQARRQTTRTDALPEALRAQLLAHYERETPILVQDLRRAMETSDWPRLLAASHYLKNSADVLQVDELRMACQALHLWTQRPADRACGLALLAAVESAARRPILTVGAGI